MGGWYSTLVQRRWVVYIQNRKGQTFGLVWPKLYSDLLLELKESFGFIPANDLLQVHDAWEEVMHVTNQQTFEALLPKHKRLEPNLQVSYICIDIP
jgi:hypothetical protein